MFVGTQEQLINALNATPIRAGKTGQVVANAAALEIYRLQSLLSWTETQNNSLLAANHRLIKERDAGPKIKALFWEGEEDECYLSFDMGWAAYELIVSDTLERSPDYVWYATYHDGRNPAVALGHGTLDEAKAVAQSHYNASTLAALQA